MEITEKEKEELIEEFYCETLEKTWGVPERFVRRIAEQSIDIAIKFAEKKINQEK